MGIFDKIKNAFGGKESISANDDLPVNILGPLEVRRKTTLREICNGLGIAVPKKFQSIADEERGLSFRSKRVRKGDICLIIRSGEDFRTKQTPTSEQYKIAIETGASLIIMGKDSFKKAGLDENAFPVILVDNLNKRVAKYIATLRNRQRGKVVMLTGSIGKTTTKDMCGVIAEKYFDAFVNRRNTNTPHQVVKHLFENSLHSYDIYIQECGAGYWGSVGFSAEMLRPDIFILTNIYGHHLQVYKTMENLFSDKSHADMVMPDDGVIITNYDDEMIRAHKFRHKVISFAIDYKDADFVASDIRQDLEFLRFNILEKATGEVTPVSVQILGEHNVYNILAAFIMGRQMGLSNEQLCKALGEYHTTGVRQNLSNVGGVLLNMDCYNVAEESLMSMLKAGEKMQLPEGGRKLALIGGENKLGKTIVERSVNFGRSISDIGFDKILFCGREGGSCQKYGDAENVMKGFMESSRIPCELSMDISSMADFLKREARPGDLVMVKGIYNLDMPIAVDQAFGTSYSYGLSVYKEEMKTIKADGCELNLIPTLGRVELVSTKVKDGKLTVPDTAGGYEVFRIAPKMAARNGSVTAVDFGGSVMNIGKSAFEGCKNIRQLVIPGNVKVIEDGAFADCTGLEEVILESGVTHIGPKAFAGCSSLKKVSIPETVGYTADDAFEGCDNLK